MNISFKTIAVWVLHIIPALILLQTLFFKFSGSEESVYIFSKMGLEPLGRYGIGVAELIAGILLLIPKTAWIGAGLGMGLMAGAIFSHFTTLGIEVMNDGGYLFILACIVFICCAIILVIRRRDIPYINTILKS